MRARPRAPAREQHRERIAALLQAGLLEAAELIETGSRKRRRRGESPATAALPCGRGPATGQAGKRRRGGDPDREIPGDKHQRMHHRLALGRGGIGDLAIGADHRRRRRQHRRHGHQRPHQPGQREPGALRRPRGLPDLRKARQIVRSSPGSGSCGSLAEQRIARAALGRQAALRDGDRDRRDSAQETSTRQGDDQIDHQARPQRRCTPPAGRSGQDGRTVRSVPSCSSLG